ncbi:MAG: 50S ribosomal protein L23 [Phycisphaerae bacterium]|nr:50S ribosomal protein L23 [Phycisphaerae bacterium]
MHPTTIIRKPLVTEKATWAAAEQNRVSFAVDTRASKQQIRDAVEDLYKVRVIGVATQTRKGGDRRLRYGYVKGATTKRAIVKIHPEDRIELF